MIDFSPLGFLFYLKSSNFSFINYEPMYVQKSICYMVNSYSWQHLSKLVVYHELAAFWFLIAGCQNGILLKSLLFIKIMEYKMIISFCHIHNYMTFDMAMVLNKMHPCPRDDELHGSIYGRVHVLSLQILNSSCHKY